MTVLPIAPTARRELLPRRAAAFVNQPGGREAWRRWLAAQKSSTALAEVISLPGYAARKKRPE